MRIILQADEGRRTGEAAGQFVEVRVRTDRHADLDGLVAVLWIVRQVHEYGPKSTGNDLLESPGGRQHLAIDEAGILEHRDVSIRRRRRHSQCRAIA